jgi:hypothetical protein
MVVLALLVDQGVAVVQIVVQEVLEILQAFHRHKEIMVVVVHFQLGMVAEILQEDILQVVAVVPALLVIMPHQVQRQVDLVVMAAMELHHLLLDHPSPMLAVVAVQAHIEADLALLLLVVLVAQVVVELVAVQLQQQPMA